MEKCGDNECRKFNLFAADNCGKGWAVDFACYKPLKGNKAPVAKSPAAMAGSAANAAKLKVQISGILMDAIGGHKGKYRTPEGFIRWGVVEGDINEMIDAVLR